MKYTQKLPSLGLPVGEQVLQAQSYLRKCQGVIPATGRGALSLLLLLRKEKLLQPPLLGFLPLLLAAQHAELCPACPSADETEGGQHLCCTAWPEEAAASAPFLSGCSARSFIQDAGIQHCSLPTAGTRIHLLSFTGLNFHRNRSSECSHLWRQHIRRAQGEQPGLQARVFQPPRDTAPCFKAEQQSRTIAQETPTLQRFFRHRHPL